MTYKQERFMSILHRTSELARKKKPSLMGTHEFPPYKPDDHKTYSKAIVPEWTKGSGSNPIG